VTIGPEGQVFASIAALEVVVQGKITGNVIVSGRLELRSEGSLTGDVVAERINVADGAFFKGKIEIVKSGQRAEGTNWGKNGRDLSLVRDEPAHPTV
jgi:cytoskeletal protein CcmA (bactofilin family)